METEIPFEITLMLRSHMQMRDVCRHRFSTFDSFAPSANMEGELGFDLPIRNLKGTVYQYKRPKKTANGRSFRIRYSQARKRKLPQLKVLKNFDKKYGPDIAFYALPLVTEHSELNHTLQQTVFVEARAIPNKASVLHVPTGYCEGGRLTSNDSIRVYCSHPQNPVTDYWNDQIDPSHIYGWWDLYEAILDCSLGFRIRWAIDSGDEEAKSYRTKYHDDHDYFSRRDNVQERDFKTIFGLGQQSGRVIARFGDNSDEAFTQPLSEEDYSALTQ
jgi:hypothetical protein